MYLYVKTHNITGLKYLGKTVQNPFKYKGSGIVWLRHINKYGYDVTTEILLETNDNNLLKETGIFYSELWNIVESKTWANLMIEQGGGGDTSNAPNFIESMKNKNVSGIKNPFYGRYHSEETKKKISDANKGKNKGISKSEETRKRMSENNARYWTGKDSWNKGKTGLQKQDPTQILKKSKPIIFNTNAYISISEAERRTGLSSYKICKQCKFISFEEFIHLNLLEK